MPLSAYEQGDLSVGEKVLFPQSEDQIARHLIEQYHAVFEDLKLGMYIWNMRTMDFQTNAGWDALGLAPLPPKLRVEDMRLFVFMEDYDQHAVGVFNFFKSKKHSHSVRYRYWTVNSDIVWVENHIYAIRDFDGGLLYIIGYVELIDDHRRVELGLPSYGLLNRDALSTCADMEIARCHKDRGLGMILIDLHRFREINELYGFSFGDQVLEAMGKKLSMLCDENMYVARSEGASFLMLVRKCKEEKTLRDIAELIQEIFAQELYVEQKVMHLKADVGAAIVFIPQESALELRRNVNIAVYRAKSTSAKYVMFDESMMAGEKRHQSIEQLMTNPHYEEYLELYLQPQYKVKSKRLFGFEALLRIHHPGLGNVTPSEFIPIAEANGKIVDIGYWVIKTSCDIIRQLMKAQVRFHKLAVNVSGKQLAQEDFVERAKQIIVDSGVPVDKIELEITESVLIASMEKGARALKELRDFGLSIAQDDFGSGYSSFNYIKDLKLDTVKIDKVFIDDLCVNPKSYHIIEMILGLAQKTSATVVAEGVETENQVSILKGLNCPVIQGYYFDRPMPVAAALEKFGKKEKSQ